MPSSNYPASIEGRSIYYGVVVPYLNDNAARLGINASDLNELNKLYDNTPPPPGTDISQMGWLQLWALYSDKKASCTTAVRNQTHTLDNKLQHLLSTIYDDIPARKWTNRDRDTLGRKGQALGHKTHHIDEEKLAAVSAELEPGGKHQLILDIRQAEGQKGTGSSRGGKPKLVREYVFRYLVHDKNEAAPASIKLCPELEIITRVPQRINFTPEQAGLKCSGYVQIIEKPNKAGPISALVSAIIPG